MWTRDETRSTGTPSARTGQGSGAWWGWSRLTRGDGRSTLPTWSWGRSRTGKACGSSRPSRRDDVRATGRHNERRTQCGGGLRPSPGPPKRGNNQPKSVNHVSGLKCQPSAGPDIQSSLRDETSTRGNRFKGTVLFETAMPPPALLRALRDSVVTLSPTPTPPTTPSPPPAFPPDPPPAPTPH